MRKQMKFHQLLNKTLLIFLSSITIASYGQLSLVSVATVDTECGMSTGSITLTPLLSGPYSYLWDNGSTSAAIMGLAMGDYSCTITNGGTTEVAVLSIYRNWELEKFEPSDNTLSIVGNSVTVNPSLPYPANSLADQRTHCYDKTPIDIENQMGSIFAKFAKTHPNFPNQVANPNPLAPPVFYIELFESEDLSNRVRIPLFVNDANLQVIVGGRLPEKIYAEKGIRVKTADDYTGYDYTDGEQFEIRFLGNHQIQVYLENALIYAATLPRRSTNEYVATIGFKDRGNLDRRIAYDLKTSFCSDMPIFKTSITHNDKYGATGSIDLDPLNLSYVNNSYSYQWSNGATNKNINNLAKGDYSVTITNGVGGTKVQNYKIYDKYSLQKAPATNSIIKIIDNHATCDPAIPMQSISDYRTHAYDPTVPINVVQGGGSVKVRVAATHPAFPNQHSNVDDYEDYKGVFVIQLQDAISPLPIPTFALDYPFNFAVQEQGRITTSGRLFSWQGQSYLSSTVKYPKGGFDIELRFVGNRVVQIYMNDIHLGNRTIAETNEEYYLMIGFSDAADRQRRIAYDMVTSFESEIPVVYTELKDKLDASYYPITNGKNSIYFYYKEDYNAGVLNTSDFVVYDNGRNVVSGVTFENVDLSNSAAKRYGTNRYKLTLPSNLDLSKFYLLEVTNEKGEKQFLRFKRI